MKVAKSRGASKPAKNEASNLFAERFVFHGNAVAAGVFITRIGNDRTYKVSPVQGQSSLPVIGGHSESLVAASDPAFANVFSYGECFTKADGVIQKRVAVTTVRASVGDLRMVNQPSPNEAEDLSPIEFRAGFLSVAMSSTHPRKGQPRIQFIETPLFDRLSLNNLPIEIELRKPLMDLSRMSDLEAKFTTNQKFYDDCCNAFMYPDSKRRPAFGKKIPRMNGFAQCSIVRSITWGGKKIDGHVLTMKGFGSIYFGEMLVNDYNRSVTLVRVKMGSDTEAEGAFAESDPGGGWWPPEN